jgi:hypothetical protein
MLQFPDSNSETEYTDPNGDKWEFNGTGWVRQPASSGGGGSGVEFANPYVAFYDADNFSESNGVRANYDGSSSQRFIPLRLNETTFIQLSTADLGTASQAFWTYTSDGDKITGTKRFYFSFQGDGDTQQGGLDDNCGRHMANHVVHVGDKAYWLGGIQYKKPMLLELSESGVSMLCKPNVWANEGDWTTTNAYQFNADMGWGAPFTPYLIREDDNTFVALCLGVHKTRKAPFMRAKVFSAADGSIIDTKYFDLPAYTGFDGNNPNVFFGWKPDPRKPDTDAVCVMPWHARSSRPDSEWQLMMFHYAGETRELTTVDFGECNSSARIRQADEISNSTWFFASDDVIYLEVQGKNVSNVNHQVSHAITLPADRLDIAGKTSCSFNTARSYKFNSTASQVRKRYDFAERVATSGRFSSEPRTSGFADYPERQDATQTSWPVLQKQKGNGEEIEYCDYITSFQSYAAPGAKKASFKDEKAGPSIVKPVISALGPRRFSTHNIYMMGYFPSSGDLLVQLENKSNGRNYIIQVKRTPDPELRLKARVVNGAIVEGPLKGKEAGVDTSGSDWWPVKADAPSPSWTEKLDDGALSVDAANQCVVLSRSAVPMSQDELVRAAIEEVESQIYPTDMSEQEIRDQVQSQLNAVREALSDSDDGDLESLQRMEYQLKTYLEQNR